jgi:cobalamin-dependent methionine synthase I
VYRDCGGLWLKESVQLSETMHRRPITHMTIDNDPSPLRFERRQRDRWPQSGVAAAYGAAGEHFGRRYVLRMLDASAEGMGARTDRPIEPGTVVTVAFAAPGHPVRNGVVTRCLPCGEGYRAAIHFETQLVA